MYVWVFGEYMDTQRAVSDPLDWSYGLQCFQYRASLTQEVSSVSPTSWCPESVVLESLTLVAKTVADGMTSKLVPPSVPSV